MPATAVEYDFATKHTRAIRPEEAHDSCERGLACWIDLDSTDAKAAEAVLQRLNINTHAIEQVLGPDREGRHDIYEDCLHFAVSAVKLDANAIGTAHVDVVVAPRLIVTVHRGPVEFLDQVRRVHAQYFE